jgi:hypothetical protein
MFAKNRRAIPLVRAVDRVIGEDDRDTRRLRQGNGSCKKGGKEEKTARDQEKPGQAGIRVLGTRGGARRTARQSWNPVTAGMALKTSAAHARRIGVFAMPVDGKNEMDSAPIHGAPDSRPGPR